MRWCKEGKQPISLWQRHRPYRPANCGGISDAGYDAPKQVYLATPVRPLLPDRANALFGLGGACICIEVEVHPYHSGNQRA